MPALGCAVSKPTLTRPGQARSGIAMESGCNVSPRSVVWALSIHQHFAKHSLVVQWTYLGMLLGRRLAEKFSASQ